MIIIWTRLSVRWNFESHFKIKLWVKAFISCVTLSFRWGEFNPSPENHQTNLNYLLFILAGDFRPSSKLQNENQKDVDYEPSQSKLKTF